MASSEHRTTRDLVLETIPHEQITIDPSPQVTRVRKQIAWFLYFYQRWMHRTSKLRLFSIFLITAILGFVFPYLLEIHTEISIQRKFQTLEYLLFGSVGSLALFGEFFKFRKDFDDLKEVVSNRNQHIVERKKEYHQYLQALSDQFHGHETIESNSQGYYSALQRLVGKYFDHTQEHYEEGLEALTEHYVTLTTTNAAQNVSGISKFYETIRKVAKGTPEENVVTEELTKIRNISTDPIDLPPDFTDKRKFLFIMSLCMVGSILIQPILFDPVTTFIAVVIKGYLCARIMGRVWRLEDMQRFNIGGTWEWASISQKTFNLLSEGMEFYRLKDLRVFHALRPNFNNGGVFVFCIPKIINSKEISFEESKNTDIRHGTIFLIHSHEELLELHRLYW